MRKVLFFMCLLCSIGMTYAQEELSSFLTDEEKNWTEKDRDNAYEAPINKIIGKKWYEDANTYWIFNQNKTGKTVGQVENSDFGEKVRIECIIPFTWKRDGCKLIIYMQYSKTTRKPIASELSKFSLRKQDELKKKYEERLQRLKNDPDLRDRQSEDEIYKITNDIVILNGKYYWFSKKMVDELTRRKEEQKK